MAGVQVDYNEILKNVNERDTIDSERKIGPLKKAGDAIVLDNSFLTREEQLKWALD